MLRAAGGKRQAGYAQGRGMRSGCWAASSSSTAPRSSGQRDLPPHPRGPRPSAPSQLARSPKRVREQQRADDRVAWWRCLRRCCAAVRHAYEARVVRGATAHAAVRAAVCSAVRVGQSSHISSIGAVVVKLLEHRWWRCSDGQSSARTLCMADVHSS